MSNCYVCGKGLFGYFCSKLCEERYVKVMGGLK